MWEAQCHEQLPWLGIVEIPAMKTKMVISGMVYYWVSHINFNIPWSLTNVWFSSRVRTTFFLWFDCSALKCHACTLFDILDLVAKCLARPKPEQSEWWEQLPKPPSTWVSSGVMSSSMIQLLTWSKVCKVVPPASTWIHVQQFSAASITSSLQHVNP